MGDLGDRMKMYESAETKRRFLPLLPVYARIDGRNFSSFTKYMDRPYDERMTETMVETTRRLVEDTGALAGYTQSDEISLLWYRPNSKSQIFFDGKIQKIVSVTAALTTSIFTRLALMQWPNLVNRKPPTFDCRAFQFPTKEEAANVFLWREIDATKNAINMAAFCKFSHKELHKKNCDEQQEMLFQAGVNFNDYPTWFKRGTFVLRRTVNKELEPEVLAKIPEQHRPDGPIERQIVTRVDMPPFSKVTNRVDVLFENAQPTTNDTRD